LIRKAQQLIDLRRHQGKHPRIGAVDVVPWIPFRGITMEECVGYARSLGAQVGQELNIPVFLYEGASRVSSRARLETIRRGGLSALETRIKADALWKPDFGPSVLHQTAGAIAIGARFFLVAFNVVLNSNDVAMAHQIAKVIRTSGGGLPSLKAMGVFLPSRSLVQVSMNLTDFRETSLRAAFQAVEQEAHSLDVAILESELVGLVPQAAWDEDLPRDLKIRNGNPDRVIERRLNQHPLFHHGSLR
ncbi:MAG: glutamate formimidoyltransferase, partial [Nitrospirales bacterium]